MADAILTSSEFVNRFSPRLPYTIDSTALTNAIKSAQASLERELQMPIELETGIVEKKLLETNGTENSYSFFVNKKPLKEVTKFELRYNDQILIDSTTMLNNIKYVPIGQISLIPKQLMLFLYYPQLFYGVRDHVPLGVEITYTAGLDYSHTTDFVKEELKNAVGRRTCIENLINWVYMAGLTSQSISMDGVSQSRGNSMGDLKSYVDMQKQQEKEWIQKLRLQYGNDMFFEVI